MTNRHQTTARTLQQIAFWLCAFCTISLSALGQTANSNSAQQLVFAGLSSLNGHGQVNAVRTDSSGNIFLLLDDQDGVRLLKTDANASAILAQAHLGAAGDSGVALSIDPSGDVYVTGTTTSSLLTATQGAILPSRTGTSTNSFVAKFDPGLNELFLTFTGGSSIVATSIFATSDAVFVTGFTYAADLPVTPSAIQQSPSYHSTQSGFVERFSPSGNALVYATYLSGAAGTTTPNAIVADASDNAFVAGSTTASGFPTIAALVPAILASQSGFLTKITPAGDGILASTFVPGAGLFSVAIDSTGNTLLATGSIDPAGFPIDTVTTPLVATTYQTLLRLPLTMDSVLSGTMLAPATQSVVAAGPGGTAWVDGPLTYPLFPIAPLSTIGTSFAIEVAPTSGAAPYQVAQTARFGGMANASLAYASLPLNLLAVAVDASGSALLAGAALPTASSSLLATETYDLPLRNTPTSALPSTLRQAETTAAACSGSLCAGSGAYVAKLATTSAAALAIATDDVPQIVLRNLGTATATNLAITVSNGTLQSNCPDVLPPGAECDGLLSGGVAGSITATYDFAGSTAVTSTSAPFSGFTAATDTLVFSPKELDFGIVAGSGTAPTRTVSVSNLGSTSQTFVSSADVGPRGSSPLSEAASDCPLAGPSQTKILAAGATCHISLGLTAGSSSSSIGPITALWSVGSRDVLASAYSQTSALALSSSTINFGTQYAGGLRLPRFLYLSNSSTNPQSHAALSLPATSPFSLIDHCPSQLPPTSICQIRLDYLAASAPSTDSTILTLDGGLSVSVTGQTLPQPGVTGSSVNPNLSVTPTSITFPTTVVVTSVSSTTETVAITNSGQSPFTLALALNGDFSEITSCTASLGAGQTCAVVITFVPSQAGVRNGLLAVTAGAGTTPVYVTLSGTGTAVLPASNGTLAFGQTPIGEPVTQFLKIAQPFTSLTVTTTGPFSAVLVPDAGLGPGNPPPSAFASNFTGTCQDCFLGLRFLPATAGPVTGTLTLASSQLGSTDTLALSGTGTSPSGLAITPASQDFGSVPVHSSSGVVPFTITNLSATLSDVTLSPPTVTGDFAISSAPAAGLPCAGTLAYGASCAVQVAFVPSATGLRSGTLTIASSAGNTVASLTGFATADTGFSLNPLALTFANTPGASATTQTITATNDGSTSLAVGTPTATTSTFSAVSTCNSLAPGASCTITVTFTPASAPVADVLSIPVTIGSQTTTYSVSLVSTYTASSLGLAISPAQALFGPTPTGTQGLVEQFTVRNFTGKALSLATDMPRDYLLVGSPCAALAIGADCTFSVAFLPLTNGTIPGSIVIQATPLDGSPSLSSIAYAEGYGIGSGTLSVQGGLIVNNLFNFGPVASGGSVSHTFTLANLNPAGSPPITVRRVTSPPPFLSTSTCGGMLAVSQSCAVTVTYSPLNQVQIGTTSPPSAADSGILTIESDAASSPNLLNLSGQSVAVTVSSPANANSLATYTLSDSSLAFPATVIGDVSAPQAILLTNSGTVAIHVSGVTAPSDFTVQNNCTTVLSAASCTIVVTSTPQPNGVNTGALAIASDASTSLEFVTLASVVVPSTLILSPTTLDFGSVAVGATGILPVQIANNSASPIQLSSLNTLGDYLVSGSCSAIASTTGSLAPNATCVAQVSFHPTATGVRPGTLSLTSSASTNPIRLSLTGIGLQSRLGAAPASLNFGSIVVGSSANLSLVLSNTGTADVTGLVLVTSNDYSVTIPCAAVLVAGSSCTAQVTFTPTAVGSRPSTLTITSSDPGSPLAVPLTGTGIQSGSFTLAVNGASSGSATVVSGQPATYALTVTPIGGFTGSIALTCTPVSTPEYASCSLNPAAVTLTINPQTGVATINTITSATSTAQTVSARGSILAMLPWVLAFGIAGGSRRLRNCGNQRLGLFSAALLAALCLCGGAIGCSGTIGDPNVRYTPAGTYQYQVTAASTSGVQISQAVSLTLVVTPR